MLIFLRVLIIGLSLFGLGIYMYIYFGKHEPAAIAPISWLVSLLGFNIFRYLIKDGTALHHILIDYWSATLHIHALLLLIFAAYYFRDLKWTPKH